MNVAYRSGTNQLHGAAWEFFRNTSLNATGYFTPPNGQKPTMQRNQFGGVLGGPIVKSKAFFFGDYEGFRQDRSVAAFYDAPHRGAEARHPPGRRPRSADRHHLPGRRGASR